MPKFKTIIVIFITTVVVLNAHAKKPKVDEIQLMQNKINQAYKLGYVNAAPIEMGAIEKKVITARTARDTRKKKQFIKLIEEIKVDFTIVEKRYEANLLYNQLKKIQQQNLESKKTLDELEGQL
ncbi:MAG: hypothetical protein L3J83_08720 [Proteobacteria bacterium]|nr:hypothetical protein [Pseudomonadota bacterium]